MSHAALDIEDPVVLRKYLIQNELLRADEKAEIRRLEGGVSNRVVLVQPDTARSFVLKQALEKLRVQVDWFCTPTRIEREALGLKYLAELAPAGSIPSLVFEDGARHVLAMEAVPEPHENWKRMLLAGEVSLAHFEDFGRLLGSIHGKAVARAGELRPIFEDRSVFEALRLEPYYRYTATQAPQARGFLAELIEDTLATSMTIVHGDYSPKNILIHAGRLILLDCEVVHFGDPAFDIGFSMAHFLGKANHVKTRRAEFRDAALRYWRVYCETWRPEQLDVEFERRSVRHSLACSLARVAGRSPLEYLTAEERLDQRRVLLSMIAEPPGNISELVVGFIERLRCQ